MVRDGLSEKLESKDENKETRGGEEERSRQQDCTCKGSVVSLRGRKARVAGAWREPALYGPCGALWVGQESVVLIW